MTNITEHVNFCIPTSSLLHYQICSSYRPFTALLFSLSFTLHLRRKNSKLMRLMDNDNTNNRLTNHATVTVSHVHRRL